MVALSCRRASLLLCTPALGHRGVRRPRAAQIVRGWGPTDTTVVLAANGGTPSRALAFSALHSLSDCPDELKPLDSRDRPLARFEQIAESRSRKRGQQLHHRRFRR